MKYIHFDVKNFAEDEDFIQWVKHPSPESDFFWNSFLVEFPEKRNAIFIAKELVEAFATDNKQMAEEDVKSLRNHLIENFETTKNLEIEEEKPYQRSFAFSFYFKVAATLLLIVVAMGALLVGRGYFGKYRAIDYVEKVSTYGERSSIILPDGSKVWLNGGSKVRYTKGLDNNGIREVFLEGEAFFEVAKNKDKPFVVNANGFKIKVLGTKFNVKSYQLDPTIETTLLEGSVSINEKAGEIVMKPNEKAIYSKKKRDIELVDVNPSNDIAWKNGQLIVENESMTEVVKKLERWYGVDLELRGGDNCNLKFKISEESLTDVLENIKEATKMSYKHENNKIVIEAKNCSF